MTKAEEILERHLVGYDTVSYTDEDYKLKQCYLNAINEAINYTHCCTELQAIEDLKDFAYNNCQLHNTDQLDEIIERL